MKAKQLPKGTWSKSIRYFYSMKNQTRFWCESLLERDALLLLEFDEDIEAYKAQPMSLTYRNASGRECRYTPDQLIKIKSSKKFVFREVKPSERVNNEIIAKIELINQHIKKVYRTSLEIITSKEIRIGSRIENLNKLYSYRRVNINPTDAEIVLSNLPMEFNYSELVTITKHYAIKDVMPLALIAHGLLSFDTSAQLNDATKIVKK